MDEKENLGIDVKSYYNRFGGLVFRRCKKLLQDEEKALDAMQDVFVKLIRYQNRLKDNHPSSLLYRISTNVCLNKIRKERKFKVTNTEDILLNIPLYDNNESKCDAENLLNYILSGKKESTHKIAIMHFVDGLTLKEISREVGLSISGVFKRIQELRLHLKKNGGME
jgi:RNA polymerase sigma-70 factor (ECF subfamily)